MDFKKIKQNLIKLANQLLVILICIQAIFCFVLLFRTATNSDMALFGYRFYYIVSPSMEPEIHVGAEIVVKETEADSLKVGDIITFESRDPAIAGYPNTHRIAGITTDEAGRKAFVTKGDNNPSVDEYPVYPEEIYGKVVAITPTLKGLIMFYSFAATPIGFMVVVVMPLMLVFGLFMRSFIKEMRNGGKKDEETEVADTQESAAVSLEELRLTNVLVEGELQPEVLQMIQAMAKEFSEANPDKELGPEEAAVFSGLLMKTIKEMGGKTHAEES